MDLSVVIVNYNVKFFLQQCLESVFAASHHINIEVFVVDNNSSDGSTELIKQKFPKVILIENKDNLGFSKANNQALKQAKGKYVLLLNPDTIVEEETFDKVVEYMNQNPQAGALGVKMIDGKGHFLPESKRGLPYPSTSFYKLSGLSRLFPKSKIFNKYHLGYLSNDEIHEVEVLSGAFMLLRMSALEKTGLLDETFFMYGEDIDLSYRITKAGYTNIYYPHTKIIHYKGESTKKDSINYVIVFYKAMIIFAKKHFALNRAMFYSLLIYPAIFVRALFAIIARMLKRNFHIYLDIIFLFIGLYVFKEKYQEISGKIFEPTLSNVAIAVYTSIWVFSNFLSGGYRIPVTLGRNFKGLILGSGIILILYALLPEQYRFSRFTILFGILWYAVVIIMTRLSLDKTNIREFKLLRKNKLRIAAIGLPNEIDMLERYLNDTFQSSPDCYIAVSPNQNILSNNLEYKYLTDIENLEDLISTLSLNEVIFCANHMSASNTINCIQNIKDLNVEVRIAHIDQQYVIGSNSIVNFNQISIGNEHLLTNYNYFLKKFTNALLSIIAILLSPYILYKVKKPWKFLKNMYQVFIGRKNWIGFNTKNTQLKPVIIDFTKRLLDEKTKDINRLKYISNYKAGKDFSIFFNSMDQLDS